MTILRRLWKSTQQGLLAAAAAVVFAALGLVLAALLPSLLGYEALIVYSGSMAPFLAIGDVAVIQPAKPQDLRVGDVVTYRSASNSRVLVTHRIIRIEAQEGILAFETKGDANPDVDYWSVAEDTVVGRVIYKVPYVGYIFDFAQTMSGRLLLVGIPALLLVIDTSRRKHTYPSLNDASPSKVDDQTQHQEVKPEASLADARVVLANQAELLASPGRVTAQAAVIDQMGQAVSSPTWDHQGPLLNDSWRGYSPTRWLHPVKLHPLEEKPLRLWALGRLPIHPATPSGRRTASESQEFGL